MEIELFEVEGSSAIAVVDDIVVGIVVAIVVVVSAMNSSIKLCTWCICATVLAL